MSDTPPGHQTSCTGILERPIIAVSAYLPLCGPKAVKIVQLIAEPGSDGLLGAQAGLLIPDTHPTSTARHSHQLFEAVIMNSVALFKSTEA